MAIYNCMNLTYLIAQQNVYVIPCYSTRYRPEPYTNQRTVTGKEEYCCSGWRVDATGTNCGIRRHKIFLSLKSESLKYPSVKYFWVYTYFIYTLKHLNSYGVHPIPLILLLINYFMTYQFLIEKCFSQQWIIFVIVTEYHCNH